MKLVATDDFQERKMIVVKANPMKIVHCCLGQRPTILDMKNLTQLTDEKQRPAIVSAGSCACWAYNN